LRASVGSTEAAKDVVARFGRIDRGVVGPARSNSHYRSRNTIALCDFALGDDLVHILRSEARDSSLLAGSAFPPAWPCRPIALDPAAVTDDGEEHADHLARLTASSGYSRAGVA